MDVYCGCDKIPKGKRLGTEKECTKKKQIRYYGIKQVDKEVLDKRLPKLKKIRDTLIKNIFKINGRLAKLARLVIIDRNRPENLKEHNLEIKILNRNKKKYAAEYDDIDKQMKDT